MPSSPFCLDDSSSPLTGFLLRSSLLPPLKSVLSRDSQSDPSKKKSRSFPSSAQNLPISLRVEAKGHTLASMVCPILDPSSLLTPSLYSPALSNLQVFFSNVIFSAKPSLAIHHRRAHLPLPCLIIVYSTYYHLANYMFSYCSSQLECKFCEGRGLLCLLLCSQHREQCMAPRGHSIKT